MIKFQIFSSEKINDETLCVEGRFIEGDKILKGNTFTHLDNEKIDLRIIKIKTYGIDLETIDLGLTASLYLNGVIPENLLFNPKGKIISYTK